MKNENNVNETVVAICGRQRDRDNLEREKILLDKQVEDLTRLCEIRGYKIYKAYLDKGLGVTDNRPAYQQMMSDLKDKKFNKILVTKSDRLFRNINDFENFLSEIKKYNCDLEISNEKIDTSSTTGKMFVSMLEAFSQLRRKSILDRKRQEKKYKEQKRIENSKEVENNG